MQPPNWTPILNGSANVSGASTIEAAQKILSERKTLLGVVLVAYGLGRTKLQCGLPARLDGRHADAQVLLSLQGHMFGHLLTEALVGAPSGG
jgi:hypothetical protein